MLIRPAQEADMTALTALYGAIGQKDDGYFARCLAEQEAGRRHVLVALDDNAALVGFVMLKGQPQYALYRRLGIPEIQDLNVVPAARRQGMGGALIDACEALAREKGFAEIGISVGLHAGYGAAQRLYVKRGYVPDGYGVTYDREAVTLGEIRPVDDNLCLMLVKAL